MSNEEHFHFHPDFKRMNRLRLRTKLANQMTQAFMAEHQRTGVTLDELAVKLGKTDGEEILNDFRAIASGRKDKGIDMMADLTLALDVELEITMHRREPLPEDAPDFYKDQGL